MEICFTSNLFYKKCMLDHSSKREKTKIKDLKEYLRLRIKLN